MADQEASSFQSISKHIKSLGHTFLKMIADLLNLVALETQLAVRSLIILLGIMLFSVLLIAFTWFSLMGALVLWIIAMGLNNGFAFLAVGVLNLLGFIPILLWAKQQLHNLGFAATRKHIASSVGLKKEQEP